MRSHLYGLAVGPPIHLSGTNPIGASIVVFCGRTGSNTNRTIHSVEDDIARGDTGFCRAFSDSVRRMKISGVFAEVEEYVHSTYSVHDTLQSDNILSLTKVKWWEEETYSTRN